jgi:hypothetical protein
LSDFSDYLKAQNKSNVRQILCYARKYASILETGDASPLLVLTKSSSSPAIRRHAMESLAAFSKYAGCYQRWQQIRQAYSLHWTNGDESLQSLQLFFNPNLSLDSMLQKVREMIRVLPAHMSAVIRFAVLTGLRPMEACESARLLNGEHILQYYNPERQALEHFRFPEIFLRPTKKAYISYLSIDNYQAIVSLGPKTPQLERNKTCM